MVPKDSRRGAAARQVDAADRTRQVSLFCADSHRFAPKAHAFVSPASQTIHLEIATHEGTARAGPQPGNYALVFVLDENVPQR